MNKKVWRDDHKMMYFINTTASSILALADGKNLFSDLVTQSLAGSKMEGISDETLESFHLKSELNDRFLQTTSFCVSMWERGILQFKTAQADLGNFAVSPLLKKAISSDGSLTVKKAYGLIAEEGEDTKYKLYNQFKANLAMLLAYDLLLVTCTGTFENTDEEVVPDHDLPNYKVGYIEPGILTQKQDGPVSIRLTGGELIIGALVGKVVDTAAQEAGTTLGDIVGRMESR
jgi:hypothetical protein